VHATPNSTRGCRARVGVHVTAKLNSLGSTQATTYTQARVSRINTHRIDINTPQANPSTHSVLSLQKRMPQTSTCRPSLGRSLDLQLLSSPAAVQLFSQAPCASMQVPWQVHATDIAHPYTPTGTCQHTTGHLPIPPGDLATQAAIICAACNTHNQQTDPTAHRNKRPAATANTTHTTILQHSRDARSQTCCNCKGETSSCATCGSKSLPLAACLQQHNMPAVVPP
jgi:hypothetical protein